MPKGREIWAQVRPLPHEGMASQIYVLDLPVARLGDAVARFVEAVTEPAALVGGQYRACTSALLEELHEGLNSRTSVDLRGRRGGEPVYLCLWLDAESVCFDAELVFWSDQAFPNSDDEDRCLGTFRDYLALVESIRSVSPDSECVLSASEAGDPREDRDESWTYWW